MIFCRWSHNPMEQSRLRSIAMMFLTALLVFTTNSTWAADNDDNSSEPAECEKPLISEKKSSSSRKKTTTARKSSTTGSKSASNTKAKAPAAKSNAAKKGSLLSRVSDSSRSDAAQHVLSERYSLMDLLAENPEENLAYQAPSIVMGSAQRMLAMIYSEGVKKTQLPWAQGSTNYFPFFSKGSDVTNGRRVVGQLTNIHAFVENVEAQARGDRSGSSPILFVGPHGTGKTEFLNVLANGAQNLTAAPDSPFRSYSYSWVGLENIPSLSRFVEKVNVGGKEEVLPIEAPLNDSPFALLPEELQDLLVEMVEPKVKEMTNGMAPTPVTVPDPQSEHFRNEILSYYAEKKGGPLTVEEAVEALNKHVVVRRVIYGPKYGTMPTIDAQGNDIDVAGLFMAPNPIVRATSNKGPTDVMAWYLTGKILRGHGNAVLFDEFLRNPEELRDMLLRAFESRVLSIGGAPDVPFDSVMIAATNTANLNDVMEEPKGHAQIDRFELVPMRWPVAPYEVSKVLLYMKNKGLRQQQLGYVEAEPAENEESESIFEEKEQHPVAKGDIDVLYPLPETNQRLLGPDGRYRLWFGDGNDAVFVSPHTVRFMSYIISATRMETSQKRAQGLGLNSKIIGSMEFRDPITRIRVLEGEKHITASERRELAEVTTLLKEGDHGISARDAGRWLTKTISTAKSREYGYTVTPALALKVFKQMIDDGAIQYSGYKERTRWLSLADQVVQKLLVPKLKSDVSAALAREERSVKSAYFDVLAELNALYEDPDARTFISSRNNQEMAIDLQRMQAIEAHYQAKNGRPLDKAQIAMFHSRRVSPNRAAEDEEFHPELLEAIESYYADLTTRLASIDDLVEFAQSQQGNEETRSLYHSLLKNMKELGYNEQSAIMALKLTNQVQNHQAQVQQQQQRQ